MKHILFLTTSNLATNPRLVKEVQLALDLGEQVSIVMFKLNNWSDSKSEIIQNNLQKRSKQATHNLKVYTIDAIPGGKLNWLYWGLSEKLAKKAYSWTPNSLKLTAWANSRRAIQLLKKGRTITDKPDFICAHNLGALYPSYALGKQWAVPFIFDVEDYHPGETIGTDTINEKIRREFLMKTLLPQAAAVTYASPLIGTYTEKLVGQLNLTETILNGFNANEFKLQEVAQKTEALRMVWFSQKISFGRGLEQVFEAFLQLMKTRPEIAVDLTLIGELDASFETQELRIVNQKLASSLIRIGLHEPLAQEKLHEIVCGFDLGLALEFDSRDLNRQICLTNKIMTYAQAGVYILATNTKAQEQFIKAHPDLGMLSGQSSDDLMSALIQLYDSKVRVQGDKGNRFEKAKALSWDEEQKKIEKIWAKF